MKRISFLQLIASLFSFRTVKDSQGDEYVLFNDSDIMPEDLKNIPDKTEFEAIENHVHLLEKVTRKEYENLDEISKTLGMALLNCLRQKYPSKHFFVYVSVDLKNSMIIRFHQDWKNEEPYYSDDDFGKGTKLFKFYS